MSRQRKPVNLNLQFKANLRFKKSNLIRIKTKQNIYSNGRFHKYFEHLFQLETVEKDWWVEIRKILAILVTLFTLAMLYLAVILKEDIDKGRIPVCEWAAVFCAEMFVGTFYFDLGKDFYIEQVQVIKKNVARDDDDVCC